MSNLKLWGKRLKNLSFYQQAQQIGFEYILNPNTGELHRVGLDNFWGSHNLADADISSFIGLNDIGTISVDFFRDGKIIPVYDLETGEIIGRYALNKCSYCFTK